MFLRTILLLTISSWLSVHCLVPLPASYRKAELALNRYISHSSYDPITHSLLNVLIHVKQAKAFISDQAIEMALENIKEFDQETDGNNEPLLRQIIYGINCKFNDKDCLHSNRNQLGSPTPDLKQRISVALDKFFENNKADTYWSLSALNRNKV
jgi:hypothetical protein